MPRSELRDDPRPETAWWSEADGEWVHGERDEGGRLQGEVRYWDAEGRLISTCEYRDDRPHGSARRYDDDGSLAQVCTYDDAGQEALLFALRELPEDRPRWPVIAARSRWRACRRSRWLDLSGNDIHDEGARALVSSPWLAQLERLELGGAELSDASIASLRARFGERVQLRYPWDR